MPCYTVRTVSLDFGAADEGLLGRAASALGMEYHPGRRQVTTPEGYVINLVDGKAMSVESAAASINALRVQYAKEAVNYAAAKLGWQRTVKSPTKTSLRKG